VVAGLRFRHLGRYADIGKLLVRYGRSDLAAAAGFGDVSTSDDVDPADAGRLADDLEKLGPTFIKLGQLLSTRPDLVSPAYAEGLARLQDDVAPMPLAEVVEVFRDQLGMSPHDAFDWFDETPLASASLGQVHRARLGNGRDVVVKVQRPGLREQVAEDMAAISELAELLDEHTDVGRRIGFGELAEQFARSMADELDYRREADNLTRLAEIVAPYERLIVPLPVHELTRERVLVMDHVGGRKVTGIPEVARTDLDGALLADHLFRAYLDQVLVAGFFHADPHPGNIVLTDDGRLGLLDLGMVARVPARLQDGLVELLLAVSEGRADTAAEVAVRMGHELDDFDREGFVRDASGLVDRAHGSSVAQIDAGTLVMNICTTAASHGLRLPPELSMLGKALLNLDHITRELAPGFDPTAAMQDHITTVIRQRVTPSRERLLAAAVEARELIEQLPSRINRMMETVAAGEFQLRVDAFDEKELLHGLRQMANRITMGLLLAALVIGAAMLSRADRTSSLATVCFLLAAGGSVLLILDIALDGRRRRRN
jgi:ubiquinone biosynthesis protein